ncbi:hypothetical protein KPL70_012061 [Citrus sinensis]|nr:hypothetical protein KPL70_012061 [Citrus sinensis]
MNIYLPCECPQVIFMLVVIAKLCCCIKTLPRRTDKIHTYRNTQNYWVKKQVQRSDEDPFIFEVTYRGTHTCFSGSQSIPQPTSREKHEQKLSHHSNNHKKGSSVNNEYLDNKEIASLLSFLTTSFEYIHGNDHCFSSSMLDENNFLGATFSHQSSSFMPHAIAKSNFYYISQYHMNFGDVHNLQQSESDLPELRYNQPPI